MVFMLDIHKVFACDNHTVFMWDVHNDVTLLSLVLVLELTTLLVQTFARLAFLHFKEFTLSKQDWSPLTQDDYLELVMNPTDLQMLIVLDTF